MNNNNNKNLSSTPIKCVKIIPQAFYYFYSTNILQ